MFTVRVHTCVCVCVCVCGNRSEARQRIVAQQKEVWVRVWVRV